MREENAESNIFRCTSSRSGSGVEFVAPKSKAFHVILAALPVVKTRAECGWRRKECSDMTGLEFEALQIIFIVK